MSSTLIVVLGQGVRNPCEACQYSIFPISPPPSPQEPIDEYLGFEQMEDQQIASIQRSSFNTKIRLQGEAEGLGVPKVEWARAEVMAALRRANELEDLGTCTHAC